MPTTKDGEKITWKEFKERWKKGIEAITPYQQVKQQLLGQGIVLVGIFWGIGFSAWVRQWWLFTILLGSLIVSGVALTSTYQRYLTFKNLESLIEGGVK